MFRSYLYIGHTQNKVRLVALLLDIRALMLETRALSFTVMLRTDFRNPRTYVGNPRTKKQVRPGALIFKTSAW